MDNGFKSVFDVSMSEDIGRLYENAAFLHLRRKSREVYYFFQKQEVDFYCQSDNKKIVANVSYDISSKETRKRELKGLIEALNFLGLDQGYLLTKDHEEKMTLNGKSIIILPLWKWLIIDKHHR